MKNVGDDPAEDIPPQIQDRLNKCLKLKNGEDLDLSDLGLSAIPVCAMKLGSRLRTLNLRNNILAELPEEFVDCFPNLQVLNLAENNLGALPNDLGALKALKKLYLQNNSLTQLPESIVAISALQEIYVQHNSLQQLPSRIAELSRLSTLSLANNVLVDIPADLSNVESLSRVDIGGNPLKSIPEKIRRLHDKNALLHSRQRRRELISRALSVRSSVSMLLEKHNNLK